MDSLKTTIKQLAKSNHANTVALRRHLHSKPELSFQEFNTARFIAKTLREMDIEVQEGIANTGLVALIQGKHPAKCTVALRADIDALPIQEANETPYKSQKKGVMHACGHDVHTASLLGTAKILLTLKEQFEGTIKLIFQPAEEKLPGGAIAMIQEGALVNPAPASILGQHVDPKLPVGKIGFVNGPMLASGDELYMTVQGKGGHAASPHLTVDPILIASHIIVALQQLISRSCNPLVPAVLSFGKIVAGEATNIIPEEVQIAGTFRTMDDPWRAIAHQKMKTLVQGLAEAMGGSCTLDIIQGYPCLRNEVDLTNRTMEAAREFVGQAQVVHANMNMGAEDFAYYAQQIPACFYLLGVRNETKGIDAYVHTNQFDIDEAALELGPGLMAWLAVKELAWKATHA